MTQETVLFRFAFALILSFAFGVARQKLGKPIGFGTFIFVALGSCALALTAIMLNSGSPHALLGSIVTGIGFLGAGALFRTADRIVGFTSAATIWVFAVFGLTVGVGEYLVASLLYLSIWAVISIDQWMETRWFGVYQRKLVVDVAASVTDEQLVGLGLPPRNSAQSLRYDRGQEVLTLAFSIHRPVGQTPDLIEVLRESPLVHRLWIE